MTSLITRIVSERTDARQCGGSTEIGYSECMSFEDKISNKAQELRGRIKRNAGQVTGDRRLEAEGRTVPCYGQGGAGVTLSWGCAAEVVALVGELGGGPET